MRRLAQLLVLAFGVATTACSTSEGEGWVRSEKLFVRDCWDGEFDLQPTFFGANPYRDTMLIRVQRGGDVQEISDGLTILVTDVDAIRRFRLGEDIPVGLPAGVAPPGVPLEIDPDPPPVSLALYLHNTCHFENGTVYSLDGSIRFESLFSGDKNESNADDRLTEASFTATFGDPRTPTGTAPPGEQSVVEGWFRFVFKRGQPAQPFP